jgi:hypothetical protein
MDMRGEPDDNTYGGGGVNRTSSDNPGFCMQILEIVISNGLFSKSSTYHLGAFRFLGYQWRSLCYQNPTAIVSHHVDNAARYVSPDENDIHRSCQIFVVHIF